MRDYGKVYTAFWVNPEMRGMSEDGRTMALYLMTCPHGNMLGCFRLPDAYAAEDLQWNIERVRKGFAELFQNRFAYRCERSFWVFIKQYLKWNQFENPNVAIAAAKMFDSLPCPEHVKVLLSGALREFSPRFKTSILDAFESSVEPFENPFGLSAKTRATTKPEPKPDPEQKPEPGKPLVERRAAPPDHDPVPEIFAYWQKTMSHPGAKLDKKRIGKIRAGLELGYTPRQMCEAIKGCSRSPHHMGQNDRNTKYNTIDLIFRSADYIDKFIELANQVTVGEETLEQKNARIIAEFLADGEVLNDPNVIDMEES